MSDGDSWLTGFVLVTYHVTNMTDDSRQSQLTSLAANLRGEVRDLYGPTIDTVHS